MPARTRCRQRRTSAAGASVPPLGGGGDAACCSRRALVFGTRFFLDPRRAGRMVLSLAETAVAHMDCRSPIRWRAVPPVFAMSIVRHCDIVRRAVDPCRRSVQLGRIVPRQGSDGFVGGGQLAGRVVNQITRVWRVGIGGVDRDGHPIGLVPTAPYAVCSERWGRAAYRAYASASPTPSSEPSAEATTPVPVFGHLRTG